MDNLPLYAHLTPRKIYIIVDTPKNKANPTLVSISVPMKGHTPISELTNNNNAIKERGHNKSSFVSRASGYPFAN